MDSIYYKMNIVYKLHSKDSDIKEFYIGSSKNFKKRKNVHKSDCNNENSKIYNIKLYKFIRANGGYNNFDYEILLETIEDNIKKIEQKYIDELKPALNCIRACGFDKKEYEKQYNKINKIKISKQNKEYRKLYYENNKQKIKEKQTLWKLKNKEKIKEKQRLYKLKNKQKIREKNRLYYLKKKLIHNDLKN